MEQRFGRKERRQGGKRLEGEGERRAKERGGRKAVKRGNKTPRHGSYPSHYITMNFA